MLVLLILSALALVSSPPVLRMLPPQPLLARVRRLQLLESSAVRAARRATGTAMAERLSSVGSMGSGMLLRAWLRAPNALLESPDPDHLFFQEAPRGGPL